MTPASSPRDRDDTRLLIVDPQQRTIRDSRITELPQFLQAHDLLVLNDAATLPASLRAQTERGEAIEIRLLGPGQADTFPALLLGAGDYRTRTEDRAAPPALRVGEWLRVSARARACVIARSNLSPRLVELRFNLEAEDLWLELYARGTPIQYAHQVEPLALWSVQTAYAGRPWAAEMPSAGRPLSLATLLALKQRGVALATLTHAAGLSATGDAAIDRALPLPERYQIPADTVHALLRAQAQGGRVIAVGTSVVRALESAALRGNGRVLPGEAVSELRIDASYRPRVVCGLLTGIHSPQESHYDLLAAFVDDNMLRTSHAQARELGYRSHEFGDACLILADTSTAAVQAA
jgi:S-adenosylmethionine:tRNA ribosyltransferase-isomerase